MNVNAVQKLKLKSAVEHFEIARKTFRSRDLMQVDQALTTVEEIIPLLDSALRMLRSAHTSLIRSHYDDELRGKYAEKDSGGER